MQREFVAVPNFWTVGKTVDYLREAAEELPSEFFDVFVIDPAYHITGQIPLNQLIRAKRSTRLTDIMEDDLITIPATMDQEDVAYQFRHDELVSAPVVDENGRLIGTITIDDVVSVIDEEAQEDILKMAGVEHGDLYRAVLSTTGTRFRWLFINLITAILASIVISFFDATIEQLVALAVLMPIVASMGGNAGTQTLTVAVRALAMKEISGANTLRIIWKESLVGSLNGILFALITGTITALWFTNPMLGIVIGLAMIVNMLVAGLFGAAIPIALSSRGADPAVSSTVFLTTLTDIVGFFVFLGLAAMLLI
jgi:magnesium transporter